jgi:hypothetical protein
VNGGEAVVAEFGGTLITRWRVSSLSLMLRDWLSTSDTVACDTPAARAISFIVTFVFASSVLSLSRFASYPNRTLYAPSITFLIHRSANFQKVVAGAARSGGDDPQSTSLMKQHIKGGRAIESCGRGSSAQAVWSDGRRRKPSVPASTTRPAGEPVGKPPVRTEPAAAD